LFFGTDDYLTSLMGGGAFFFPSYVVFLRFGLASFIA